MRRTPSRNCMSPIWSVVRCSFCLLSASKNKSLNRLSFCIISSLTHLSEKVSSSSISLSSQDIKSRITCIVARHWQPGHSISTLPPSSGALPVVCQQPVHTRTMRHRIHKRLGPYSACASIPLGSYRSSAGSIYLHLTKIWNCTVSCCFCCSSHGSKQILATFCLFSAAAALRPGALH